jgi:hypothetical protein
MSYPVVIFWALIAWSVTTRPSTLLVLLLASMPFASLAMLPPEITGGLSILPQSLFAVILILKVVVPQVMPLSPKLLTALQLRNLGYLALFLLVGTVATVIMPRLFAGEVVVVPTREMTGADVLSFTPQNFSQWAYVTLSVMSVFSVTLLADEPSFERKFLVGMLAGGIVCIVTGLIDYAAGLAGVEYLLAPFRTAQYAYLTEADISGIKRVVGFTPEASAYGPICVDFAAAVILLRPLYAESGQRILPAIVGSGLVVMALLSTSSTAYAGLAVLGLAYAANWVRRAFLSSRMGQSGLLGELFVGLGLIIVLLFVLIVHADLFNPLVSVIDEIIISKPLSSSFYERSFWNSTAWNAVASTWGLGVGFGSTRTSSWFVAIISNTGLVGAAFMAMFLVKTLTKRPLWPTPSSAELLPALKLSLLPALVMVGVDSAGSDFGPWISVVFGTITGIAALHPRSNPVRPAGTSITLRAGERWSTARREFGRNRSPTPRGSGSDKPAPGRSF